MGQKLSNIHCLIDKTMTMRGESYLTKTYLTISGSSSCRYYNRGSFTQFLGETLVIWQSRVGRGHNRTVWFIAHPHILVRATSER